VGRKGKKPFAKCRVDHWTKLRTETIRRGGVVESRCEKESKKAESSERPLEFEAVRAMASSRVRNRRKGFQISRAKGKPIVSPSSIDSYHLSHFGGQIGNQ